MNIMKKNTIRLTESELKNMIVESVKKILSEGMNDISSNTHYAIHKPTGKIVFSWDYTGYDPEDLKLYKKDYFTTDLLDMEMDPREITVITRKTCERRGIDPTDDANWLNYPMSESIIQEIGDTPKGQRALGGLTARKKLAHKDHIPTYRYAEKARGGDDWDKFAYPNATIDAANPMYKDYAQGYTDYLNAHPDEAMEYERKERLLREFNSILQPPVQGDIIEVDLMYLEFSNPQLEEFFEDAKCPEAVSVKVEYTVEPINRGDYWTPPSGGEVEIENMEVDYDGVFKNIIPTDLYQSFVSEVQSYVNDNWDRYSENYEEYEPDSYDD